MNQSVETTIRNMLFEKGHIYHVYNQGNNRQKIFFRRENYIFFLQKMRVQLLPYADILAWCLMPNHFHWMLYIRETEIDVAIDGETDSRGATDIGGATQSRTPNKVTPNNMSLNKSIGILLASYTRAINKQEGANGSLFRARAKAECVTKPDYTPSFYNTEFGTHINIPNHEKEYPQQCFRYIHDNPVKAGLVNNAEDWEFSSYQDIVGIRNGKLINRDKIEEFGLTDSRGAT